MNNTYMLLWLEAPLQSWGSDSKFFRRETLLFPSKSALYGMYLSAMGLQGKQQKLLEQLAPYKQTVVAFNKPIKSRFEGDVSEKTVREPVLVDFHMVGSGYRDDKDHQWEQLLIPKKSDGKKAKGGGSKITYRYYLQDARFAVIQQAEASFSEQLSKALIHPIYDMFLGRKNCIPTDFVYQGTFDTEDEALEGAMKIGEEKGLVEGFRVLDGEYDEYDGDVRVLNDVPIQFGSWKKYTDRSVTVIKR